MTKKHLLVAGAVVACLLLATNSFGQGCTGFTKANVKYVAVGSSAQFNSFAYAAEALIAAEAPPVNVVNFWASTSFPLQDVRDSSNTFTDTAKVWVAWDNAADCTVYAYFTVDSSVGTKDFFAYKHVAAGVAFTGSPAYEYNAVYGNNTDSTAACAGVVNPGLPPCAGYGASTGLPTLINSFFNTAPGPTSLVHAPGGEYPYSYCGQALLSNPASGKFCFFNVAHTDIRPEDTLYATTRALSVYNSTNGLAGLGYNNTTCGAVNTTTEGCPFLESFGQGNKFNTLKFAISGNDPIGGAAAVPTYTTLNIGAAPVVVFVNDADTSTLGFGAGAPGPYTFTNINHKVLAGLYDGTFSCTGDVLPGANGPGMPVQVVQREALSGTYNTFEFTGVRTLSGSAATAVAESKASSITWFTDDDSGQELNNNPAANLTSGNCGGTIATFAKGVNPTGLCSDPLYLPTGACGTNGNGLKLRAITTGEMVKATLDLETKVDGTNPQLGSSVQTPDGLGYAFWGYGNLAPMAAGCSGTASGAYTSGCSYLGHYLTVDGIDPLFTNPGDSTNPNGAYHAPQCFLGNSSSPSGFAPSCFAIPFTHIKDGSYPLWTVLRAVTFNSTTAGQATPPGVLAMIAEGEKAAGDQTKNLDDFFPYFTNICEPNDTTPPCNNSTSNYVGDLNLGVFRSHYKQTNNPDNGYAVCTAFTSLPINGAPGTCTVDVGGDLGGSVFTVQSDLDFHTDFGGITQGGGGKTSEIIGLHQ